MSGDVVELRALTKRFKSVTAVDGLDLRVPAGARVGLLGPNGAGKTTTLLMLLGVILPDAGSVTLVGHELPRHRSKALGEVGFVAGYLPLPENLTVFESLEIFAGFYGIRRPGAVVRAAVERFGLGRLVERRGQELSSGQRTLVGIVKAVLHRPRLLVLDEPTASLDPDVALRVRAALLDVHREDGTALLVTSHNMREVEILCERVVILGARPDRGRRLAGGDRPAVRDGGPGGRVPRGRRADRVRGRAAGDGVVMSAHRIAVVVRRHWLVLWRSPHRWFEVGFWPLMDVILWGSLGVFVARQDTASRAGTAYLLAGIVLFHVLFQVQITATTGVMEETWTRNLLNVLTTPVTELEYVVAVGVFGLLKTLLAMAALTVTTIVLFGFDLSQVGWAVIPVAWILVLNGWALALLVIGLILRFGQSAEILTWGLNYVVMALSGVFFPVDALPPGLRSIAAVLPTTWAFSALRRALDGLPFSWVGFGVAFLTSLLLIVLSGLLATHLLKVFRRRGFVTRYS